MAKKTTIAGAFDIRNIIGTLLGIYGIILVIAGLLLSPGFDPDAGILGQKSRGDNIIVGIIMIIVAAIFIVWTRLRPIVVDEAVLEEVEKKSHNKAH